MRVERMGIEYKSHDLEHLANLDEARERAKVDVYFKHAADMVKYGGYTWEQALVSICLKLGEARDHVLKEYGKHMERCAQPSIIVLGKK
jgi:hypothetical protein